MKNILNGTAVNGPSTGPAQQFGLTKFPMGDEIPEEKCMDQSVKLFDQLDKVMSLY